MIGSEREMRKDTNSTESDLCTQFPSSNEIKKKYRYNTPDTERERESSLCMHIVFYCYVFHSEYPSIVSISTAMYTQVVHLVVKTTMLLNLIL